MFLFSRGWGRAAATAVALLSRSTFAQTWSACNPLTSTSCPADTALGMTIHVDFAEGEVNSFVPSGGVPTYGEDGVSFTVASSGDAPQLTSIFYIMFGRVEVTMKAAPGAGIVSSLVLLSDALDEIDMEWLGADSTEVQTNYFSKGQTTTYNRGQFNPAPNNQAEFITYTIDWTADRIAWYVGGTLVRTLTFDEANGEYPQTPMQVKFGAWSGGDPSNPPGTIEWARGPTDYSQGPFSMVVRSAVVTDYSTGKRYTYGDQSGTWQSIRSDGGEINGNLGAAGTVSVTASAPAATDSLSPTIPPGGIIGGGTTATDGSTGPSRTVGPIPDGWVMTSEGKVVPIGSSTALPEAQPSSSLSRGLSASPSTAGSGGGETTLATSTMSTLGGARAPTDAPPESSASTARRDGLLLGLLVLAALLCW
ncbi:glycoside hydrolase family 16 protein [Thermothelomyces heterothallicus CBS 202.75]|uniref:glycoside hydrolase family 16 protein n=1 Tax=Thermothelomyces heterothallicus CBS 202.75 TaxID=1149848 RepID=UPI003742C0C5